MMKREKKIKQPAKKRNKGTLLHLNSSIENADNGEKGVNKKNNANKQEGNNQENEKEGFELNIPEETKDLLGEKTIDNFHLKLNRFALYDIENAYKVENQKISENFFYQEWEKDYSQFIDEHNESICTLFNKENLIKLDLKTSYYLLIGSEESIYETSIRLHHIYGFPYIPSSAIKGTFRNYIINTAYEKSEKKALACPKFIEIFGSQDNEGKVIFFDAFPKDKPSLKIDILNPHYKDYYDGKSAPTDTQNPVPVKFLTVKNTSFTFIIGFKENKLNEIEDIKKSFKECLKDFGIGAKTSVGYGDME